MRVRVCYHDNCFDGAASAALFTRFYKERVDPTAEFLYRGVQHKSGDVFPPGTFDGDENAVVDFRYSPDPKLTWWFDHHISAFQPPETEPHFRQDHSGKKFYDPTARSCTRFLALTCADKFGFDITPHAELIHWGELIDSASFESPESAVALREPALRIMTWIENNKRPELTERLIADFAAARPLADIAAEPWIAEPLVPILAQHAHSLEVMRARARTDGPVVYYDVSEDGIESANKFIPYFLHPECRFVVGVSLQSTRAKISVGTNPWLPRPPVNIAKICERYGGGGHPVVGAISMPVGELSRARTIAGEIVEELKRVELK